MLKQIPAITLLMVSILSLASCQTSQISLPTPSPVSLDLPAQTPTAEVITSTNHLCFTPVDLIPISFTPDSKMLVIRTHMGMQLFNLERMKEEIFARSPRPIVSAALSTNGQILAWSFEDYSIQLIRASDGTLLNTLKGHTDLVFKLRFSPNGDRLFSGSHDGSVRIWDIKGRLLKVIETNGEVLGIGISPDETRLATIPFDGPVELWDLASYQKISTLGGTGGFDTSDAVFSPDGKYLAADLATGLFLWRISDGKSLWDDLKNSLAVTFSPNGKFLAYADVDKNEIVLSSPNGAQIIRTLEGMQGTVWELFFSPDSSMLAATDGGEIRIWQVENGQLLYIGKASCP
jgi:WD40 repeat protein